MLRKSWLVMFVALNLAAGACVTGQPDNEDRGVAARDSAVDSPIGPVPDGGSNKDRHLADMGGKVPGTWVTVQPGAFTMGAAAGEPCSDPTLERKHSVTLTRRFQIMTTEVTQKQFMEVMGYNRSYFKTCGDNCPVDSVSAHEAAQYCNALSAKMVLPSCYTCQGKYSSADCDVSSTLKTIQDCKGFRLPTEAEWEYAYRAGTQTAFYNGDIDSSRCDICSGTGANANKIGWYCANTSGSSADKTRPVGQKAPNKWGLYDMAGNLYEWTADSYVKDLGSIAVKDPHHDSNPSESVVKGGCWEHRSKKMRAAFRKESNPKYGTMLIGFRPVRTLP